MIERLRKTTGHWMVVLGIILTALVNGCQTGSKYADLPPDPVGIKLHVGEVVTVTCVSPGSGSDILVPVHTERIGEDGTITLDLIGSVAAVGKTPTELQREIRG